jgi:hypothetical protein
MDQEKKRRLRAQAVPLSTLAVAVCESAAKNGDLDAYRTGKALRADLEKAGAFIPPRARRK